MSSNAESGVDIEEIRKLIAEELEVPAEEVTDGADLASDLEVDSLSAMEIAVLLEKKYKIKISEEEIKSLTSLPVIHELVAAKVDAV